jgi:YebC/PmpR family DNA-binding regulatory protein
MSGHSKWSTIKRQKGVADARRGQLFTKLAREIIVSVRKGGANPDSNFQLRLAIQRARDNNMPLDNIERAMKRASGSPEASELSEIILEGYGPGGVAILVKALTNNRNRTIQDVRRLLTRHGGSMGENGCVSWIFETKGVILVDNYNQNSEELALLAIDAGADDVKTNENDIEIYTQPKDLEEIRKLISVKNKVLSTEIAQIPKTTMVLGEKESAQVINMIDDLEELDDVQYVYSNAVFSEITLEELSKNSI